MTQYWVVGATVSGQGMTEKFIKHEFWFGDKDTAQDKIDKIQIGDRMAIKRMLGHGAKDVAIKTIGVVEDIGQYNALTPVASNFKIIYVKWIFLLTEDRKVPFSGFGGAVHGPFDGTEPISKQIFSL
jgi:hypothetical protein